MQDCTKTVGLNPQTVLNNQKNVSQNSKAYICSNVHLGLHLAKIKLMYVNFLDIKILSPFPSLLPWLFAMLKKLRNSGSTNGVSLGWYCLGGVFGKPV